MLAYVLLIVIALALSVIVYGYLRLYVPKQPPECPPDISLVIQDYSCADGKLNITFINKGLFKVDAAYVRLGLPNAKVRNPLFKATDSNLYLTDANNKTGLLPGNRTGTGNIPVKVYDIAYAGLGTTGTFVLEVQPAVYSKDILAACSRAIIVQNIECT